MNAALALFETRPAATAFVVATGGLRAGPATDGAITAIVQDVVREFMFLEVGPDLVATPIHEWIEFPDVRIIGSSGEAE